MLRIRQSIRMLSVVSTIILYADISPAGPSPAAQPSQQAVDLAGKVPLVDAVKVLEPRDVWQNFYELTRIPRPSRHEEKVRGFLARFGNDLGLETIVDGVGNVIIRKPPSKGMENRKGVILQAHMDMVAQMTAGKAHDFMKDPVQAYVEGEWVKADGTTLGADDGMGVAIAMAVLQSKKMATGPIDVLFTVNEEDGLDGVQGLMPGLLKGDILINLDSEVEGEFTIGSAGGEYANIKSTYPEVDLPAGMAAYHLTVNGLKGGHSGLDIHLGRGHAVKLLVRFLKEASRGYGLRLAQFDSGTAANAIPREASALVCIPRSRGNDFFKRVREYEGILRKELGAVETNLSVTAAPADLPARGMDEKAQRDLLDALYGSPQGVMRMSDVVAGLVETSTNTGIVHARDGKLEIACLTRSSVDTSIDDVGGMLSSIWELAGTDVRLSRRYPGWRPNPGSPIVRLMARIYGDLYGKEVGIVAVHAGLECSTIGAKYPNLDIVSIGPTMKDVHSPDERLFVPSVKKVASLLTETLEQIPEK